MHIWKTKKKEMTRERCRNIVRTSYRTGCVRARTSALLIQKYEKIIAKITNYLSQSLSPPPTPTPTPTPTPPSPPTPWFRFDKYVSFLYFVTTHLFIFSCYEITNIHHSWPIVFRNYFRFTNKPAYSITKIYALYIKLILFWAFMGAVNPKCRLFFIAATNTLRVYYGIFHVWDVYIVYYRAMYLYLYLSKQEIEIFLFL